MSEPRRELVEIRKTGGRPRNAEASANVCVRVPAGTFEDVRTSAQAERLSISAYVRKILVLNHPRR